MNIQLSTFCAAINLRYTQQLRQSIPNPSAKSADSVTISQAARERLAAETGKGSDSALAKLLSGGRMKTRSRRKNWPMNAQVVHINPAIQ